VVATITTAGGEAIAIKADITLPNDVTAMIDEIDQQWRGIDVLVHSVSTPFAVTSFAKLSWEQLGSKLDSELRAAFLTTKTVVPGMVSRGYGRLPFVLKVDSNVPSELGIVTGNSHYAAIHFIPDVFGDLVFNDLASDVERRSMLTGVQGDASHIANDRHTLRAGFAVIIGGPVTAPTAPGRTVDTSLTFVCSPLADITLSRVESSSSVDA
jgi:3-oxoacyl-[acyl-carrier protein] reductase